MGIMWISVGLLAGLSVFAYVELAKRFRIDWRGWTGLILGEFSILFCIAWSVASVAEGVPRSASMGVIMFGGVGLVIMTLTWRLVIQSLQRSSKTIEETATVSPGLESVSKHAATAEVDKTGEEGNGSTRRQFFGQSLLQAIGWKRGLAGAAAIGAGGVATYAVIKSRGTPLDDVPNELSVDYKPYDQRNMIFTFVKSRKLQQQFAEQVRAWESRAHERGKDFFHVETAIETMYSTPPEDTPGYRQIDYALMRAAWLTNDTQAAQTAFGQPGQGVFTWGQSDVSEKIWDFKSKGEAALAIKTAAKMFGAVRCGITRRDRRWDYDPIYDPIEEKELRWEQDFPFKPKTVIVCLVEMDYPAMSAAPAVPASATSGQGYSEMTVVAGQLAKFLRLLGYKAVASGNDLGLSVPYAVAAGLGEDSRAGWLIAPTLGPRLRICKVYTDLELVEYDRPRDYSINSFCVHCKRCADACPSDSITHESHPTPNPTYDGSEDGDYSFTSNKGVLKWHNDGKKCYEYWVESGSSCAACIAACPYNKPDFWHHDLVDTMNVVTPGPLHWFMKEMDMVFGYGIVNDPEKTERFWKSGSDI
jgi:reductive dehalogenase